MSTLQEARASSTRAWQADLLSLFNNTERRFPDVVWAFPNDGPGDKEQRIYGHKAIVYARAPPSFQNRYFNNPGRPPLDSSQLSLPSPSRTPSPMPKGEMLRIQTDINPALFAGELEYLYTAKGFGEAFEFLFDSRNESAGSSGMSGGAIGGISSSREDEEMESNADAVNGLNGEDLRIDKLRKDLVFMWRSRLYSDVRIALTGSFSSDNHEPSTAIFSSHRFILISRSEYFRNALLEWPSRGSEAEDASKEFTLTLPSPPFTPASLHFTLGFIYTGTLVFSHRSYDLDTAFAILRSAMFLSLPTLEHEIQARIVQEMLHGLFHAPLEFAAYEQATGGRWGTGGCRCRQCARRAPRVLEFALSEDVKNPVLDRGARRALVGLFGEGWCTSEFAALPQKTKDNLLKGVGKRTTPLNAFALLWASHHALQKLDRMVDVWADNVREYILAGRRGVDECLATHSEACFVQEEWNEIMENNAIRFDDGDKLEWIVGSLKRGVNDRNAATLYQTVVSSILLRPQPGQPDQAFLPQSSPIRDAVDTIRSHVIQFLRKRWINVRQEGGFDDLEGWAVKEIADYIDVPLEDLLIPAPKRTTVHAHHQESDASSMRVSILSRNLPRQQADNRSMRSGVSSIRSRSGALTPTSSKQRAITPTGRRTVTPTSGERPDSKLTPPTPKRPVPPPPAIIEPDAESLDETGSVVMEDEEDEPEGMEVKSTPSTPMPKGKAPSVSPSIRSRLGSTSSTASSRQSIAASVRSQRGVTAEKDRPKSSASSIRSVSSVRTVKGGLKPSAGAGKGARSVSGPSSRPTSAARSSRPPSSARPTSSMSSHSTTFHTAPSMSRTRTTSSASTVSVKSTKSSAGKVNNSATTTTTKKTMTPTPRPSKSPVRTRAPSTFSKSPSVASTTSTASTAASRKASQASIKKKSSTSTLGKGSASKKQDEAPPLPTPDATPSSSQTLQPPVPHPVKASTSTSSMASRVAPSLKRKTSASTVTSLTGVAGAAIDGRGATLSVGIPCIISISARRKRIKALARYIGEVQGENGSWVGVEIPNPPSQPTPEERWTKDGSWMGVRYFDISADPDDFTSSVRGQKRAAPGGTLMPDVSKRMRRSSLTGADGAMTPKGRGLFVRPQQVLYVVDAIDGDL